MWQALETVVALEGNTGSCPKFLVHAASWDSWGGQAGPLLSPVFASCANIMRSLPGANLPLPLPRACLTPARSLGPAPRPSSGWTGRLSPMLLSPVWHLSGAFWSPVSLSVFPSKPGAHLGHSSLHLHPQCLADLR